MTPRTFVYAPFALVLVGCTLDAELGTVPADTELPEEPGLEVNPSDIPTGGVAKLDLLVVVDNSGSMREEQESLSQNFDALVDELSSLPGGLPDLHLGVVSTDMGAGPFGIESCDGVGDDGALQVGAGGCELVAGSYIVDEVQPVTGERIINYSGTLKEAFSCNAALGTQGCGFEQPLQSMRRALEQDADNFLRPDAHLAIVIVSDEDDCSVHNSDLFDPSQDALDHPLGPLSSFRCSNFGLLCDGGAILREDGSYSDCVPLPGSPYLYHPDQYVTYLASLKGNPDNVIVAVIAGERNGLEVVLETAPMDNNQEAVVQPSCVSGNGEADPAYRLGYFAEQFKNHSVNSICDADLSGALQASGRTIRAGVEGGLADPVVSPPPNSPMRDDAGCRAAGAGSGLGGALLMLLAAAAARRRRG